MRLGIGELALGPEEAADGVSTTPLTGVYALPEADCGARATPPDGVSTTALAGECALFDAVCGASMHDESFALPRLGPWRSRRAYGFFT